MDKKSGWYPAAQPKIVRVFVDNDDNEIFSRVFDEDYWYEQHLKWIALVDTSGWHVRAHWSARDFADRVRQKGITANQVAYPAHRIHKVVISDYVDSTDGD